MPYYNYKNSICQLDEAQATSAIKAAEMSKRTGALNYVGTRFFKEQAEDLKKNWPAEATAVVREMIKAEKPPIDADKMRRIAMKVILDGTFGNKLYDKRSIAAEMALSVMFRRAPDYNRSFRPYRQDGPTIGYKVTTRPYRMVIDNDKVAQADVFVYFYYCEEVEVAMALGYSTQGDVKDWTFGNFLSHKDCAWTKEAYFQAYKSLRPMSEFVRNFKIDPIPDFTMFESPPEMEDLPLEPSMNLKMQLEDSDKVNGNEDEEFLRSILGLKDKKEEHPSEKANR